MIPYLPKNSTEEDAIHFYNQIVENLEMRASHHEAWHTHKRDSSVCWICDLIEVSKLVIREMERFISKSALDIDEQSLVQDINSEDDTAFYDDIEEPRDVVQS